MMNMARGDICRETMRVSQIIFDDSDSFKPGVTRTGYPNKRKRNIADGGISNNYKKKDYKKHRISPPAHHCRVDANR